MNLKNKKLFRLSFGTLAVAMVIGFSFLSSCKKDDNDPPPAQNIVQLAQGNANLSSLVAALGRFPDLVGTLSGAGTFTVFAPTNAAFTAFLAANNFANLEAVPDATLRSVLQYHVVSSAALRSTQLVAGNLATVGGSNIAVTLSPLRLNANVEVTTADVIASNGVVHVINTVLTPPPAAPTQNIVQLAQGNANLSSLVAALTRFPNLVSTLSGTGTFTVFAPTNAAFTAFLAANNFPNLAAVPDPILRSVLEYHVVSSAALRSTQLVAGNIATVGGPNIAVTLNPLRLNTSVEVATADVIATNGVVHVVNAVLQPTVLQIALANADFDVLEAAAVRAGADVTNVLSGTTQITVFAPTDAAFIANLNVATEAAAIAAVTALTQPQAADLLRYHVIAGRELKADAIATGSVTTARLTNNTAFVNRTGSVITVNNATVRAADVDASNGVIHVIDAVLTPPVGDIVAVATSTANAADFNILVAALTKAGLAPTLQGTTAPAPFTVFAPTDAAFVSLLSTFPGVGSTELEVLNFINNIISPSTTPSLAALTSILTYHVVSGTVAYSINLSNGQVLPTVKSPAPNTITVGISGSTVTIDGLGSTPSTVAPANISATNGVVHVINRVMLFE
jgi:transforming growth factor-beta-induced protein